MKNRRVIVGILLAMLLATYAWIGVSKLSYDVDITRLLPQNLPETQGYQAFLRHFSRKTELFLTVETTDKEKADKAVISIATALQSQPEMVKKVVFARDEFAADQWTELTAWSLLNASPEKFAALEARLAPDKLKPELEAKLEQLANSADMMESKGGYDPLGLLNDLMQSAGKLGAGSEFASADGKFRVLYVESARPISDYREAGAWLADVRAAAEKAAGDTGAKIRFTGEPAFQAEISRTMEADMKTSGATTMILISLLVFLAYRNFRLLPMIALALVITFLLTLATCGILLGSLTALTVGFGSILIGLSADYGVMVYQRAQETNGDYVAAGRLARVGVSWAAATTAVVFIALLPLGFPGLSELGMLVAAGVIIGALIMLWIFPLALQKFAGKPKTVVHEKGWFSDPKWNWRLAWIGMVILGVTSSGLVTHGLPKVDVKSGSLRPKESEAFSTMDTMQARLTGGTDGLTLLISGESEQQVAERLQSLKAWLEDQQKQGRVAQFTLPQMLWPSPKNRETNAIEAAKLVGERERLRQQVFDAGFTDEAFGLAQEVLGWWEKWQAAGTTISVKPQHENTKWMLARLTSINASAKDCVTMGFVSLDPGVTARLFAKELPPGVFLTGGELLNQTLNHYLEDGFLGISILFGGLTLLLLAIALREWKSLGLVLLGLTWSYAGLLGAMSWLGIPWNVFTLPALLLSLGTGSDYFIYVILELRNSGTAPLMRARLGKAIIVCAGNSIIGFASLMSANSSGLASLGLVCALALTLNTLCALLVIPAWWGKYYKRPKAEVDA